MDLIDCGRTQKNILRCGKKKIPTPGVVHIVRACLHETSPAVKAGKQCTHFFLSGRMFSNQALKLVKQIIAVDSSRLPREVVRTVVAVSGHKEDNFRRVCQNAQLFCRRIQVT